MGRGMFGFCGFISMGKMFFSVSSGFENAVYRFLKRGV